MEKAREALESKNAGLEHWKGMESLPAARPARQGADSQPKPKKGSWTKVDDEIMARTDLTSTAKLVYAVIVNAMRGTGVASVGYRLLMERIGVSSKTIVRAIKTVGDEGLLVVKHGASGQRTTYQLPSKALAKVQRSAPGPVDKSTTLGGQKYNASAGKSPTRKEQMSSDVSLSTDLPEPKVPTPTKKRTRKKDPIWDAVCEVFDLRPVTRTQEKHVGKIVAELKQHKATPEEIRQHAERYRREWPKMSDTPEAVLKHWERFKGHAERPARRTDYAENQRALEAGNAQMEVETRRRTIAVKVLSEIDAAVVEAAYDAFIGEQPANSQRYWSRGRVAADRFAITLAERLAPGRIKKLMANGKVE